MTDKINEGTLKEHDINGISEKSFNSLNDEQKNIVLAGHNSAEEKKKEGGKFGEIFGTNPKNASIHIAFVICGALLTLCAFDLFHSFCKDNTLTSEVWNLVFPVVTLALGYIFGKGENS